MGEARAAGGKRQPGLKEVCHLLMWLTSQGPVRPEGLLGLAVPCGILDGTVE